MGNKATDIADITDYALSTARKLNPDYAEVCVEHSNSRSFAVEQGKVNGESYVEEKGLRIRILKKGRMYTFTTNKLEKSDVTKLLSRFKQFDGLETKFSSEAKQKAKYEVKQKENFQDADMLTDLIKMDKELSKPKYVQYRSLYAGFGSTHSFYTNTDGTTIESTLPSVSSFMSIIVGNGKETRQRFLQFGGIGGYEAFNTRKITDSLLQEAKNMHNLLEKGVTLSKDELAKIKNVVISPEIMGIAVHESVGHANEADRIFGREAAQAGMSYVNKDNLGLRIGSDAVTIIDDPTIPNTYGFYLYDDEGVKARPKEIVKNGMQNELLLNRAYAHILKKKSNAAARSDSYYNEPLIRMSNSYLKPGRAKFHELVKEANNGAYIKNFTEWNIDDTRTFARYQGNEAYLIKNGSVEKPIKNFTIESTTLNFWNAVRLIDNEMELYLGNCGKGEPMQGVPVTMGGAAALLSFK